MLKIELGSKVILKGVIHLIFQKALDELKYSSMYAQLCKRLSIEVQNFEYDDKKKPDQANNNSTFLSILLSVCQDKFNNRSSDSNSTQQNGSSNGIQHVHLDEEERKYITKQKMLGNVKFIGELFKLEILHENVLHKCILELLSTGANSAKERCENMECLSQIIRTCGKILDTEKVSKTPHCVAAKIESNISLSLINLQFVDRRKIRNTIIHAKLKLYVINHCELIIMYY